MLSIVPLLAVIAAGPLPSANAALESPGRHIRTTDVYIKKLLRAGYERSPTFAHLVAGLEGTDVIVYIEVVPRLPGAMEGRLLMIRAHEYRYVRIQVELRGDPQDTIALIGHELQHATEVAGASAVRDQAQLIELYERIGIRGGDHIYETRRAQEMGRGIRKELG